MMFQESLVMPALYTQDEEAVIKRWIQQAPVYPERDDLIDSNRVAEISLYSVQSLLPKGLSITEDGTPVLGRKTWDCSGCMRNDLLYPIHLFEINWADSPGWTWPEVYYATFLPGYDVYAVTLSQGSADSYDYFDLAIGFFRVDKVEQIAEKSSRIVQDWWQFQRNEWSQWAWVDVLNSGLVEAGLAFRLRDEVWQKRRKT
ncbi:MAG: hypothetical protein HGB23_12165 [Chlorobiaceae bacterium]|nr:hypothetical protein [Chlorobiaceae bacterium]